MMNDEDFKEILACTHDYILDESLQLIDANSSSFSPLTYMGKNVIDMGN